MADDRRPATVDAPTDADAGSRRAFLAKLPLAAAATGMGGLAGCTEDADRTVGGENGEENANPLPAYAGWLYDPTPVLDVDNRMYATFDVASLYENRDRLPEGLFDVFDAADDALDALDVPSLGNVTTFTYSKFDPAAWSTNPESGLTMVVEGAFDADAIRGELDALDGVEDAGTHGDYRVHTTNFEWDLGSFGERTASVTVGTGGEALVVGMTFDVGEDVTETVTRAIDARAGERDGVADAFADSNVLLREMGETTFGIAFDVRDDLLDNVVDDEDEALDDAAKDVVGIGLDLDFDAADLRGDTLVVFDDVDTAADVDLESLLASTDQTALGDGEVDVSGRVARITSSVDARALWTEYWPDVEFADDQDDGSDADAGTVDGEDATGLV